MSRKLKILLSAYACSPGRGSEPGMGWNFVTGLAGYHEVHVISEQVKWENPVMVFLGENPELSQNLKFYFIPKKRNRWLRKIWPPSYYWYYRQWQKKVYQLALELDMANNFDLIHQLNMVGYREPGFLWKIKKPFVWGPIGGLENSPWSFLPSLGLKGMIFYSGRNIINWWQRNFLKRPRLAAVRSNSQLIAATQANAEYIKKLWGRKPIIMSEVGQEYHPDISSASRVNANPLKIIWSGQHTPGKNLSLLIKVLSICTFPFELHILGAGTQTTKWQKLARKVQIEKSCIWHGWLEKAKAIAIMKMGHVMCITSIKDLTSTVTMEALSFGLPVVCLDHCGFSHIIDESCGIKVAVTNPNQSKKDFANALEFLFKNEDHRQTLGKGAIQRASEFSWDRKIVQLNDIYYSLLSEDT